MAAAYRGLYRRAHGGFQVKPASGLATEVCGFFGLAPSGGLPANDRPGGKICTGLRKFLVVLPACG
jgi:hypothetical protein